jgi:hypothetical protein
MEVTVRISESYEGIEGKKYVRVNKILPDESSTQLNRTMEQVRKNIQTFEDIIETTSPK